jgi:hypothetical protein
MFRKTVMEVHPTLLFPPGQWLMSSKDVETSSITRLSMEHQPMTTYKDLLATPLINSLILSQDTP